MFADEIDQIDQEQQSGFKVTLPGTVSVTPTTEQTDDSATTTVVEGNIENVENKEDQNSSDGDSSKQVKTTVKQGGGDTSPEMIEYKEPVIIKRIGETFKEKGFDINFKDDEEVTADSFVNKLQEAIVTKDLENKESEIYKKARKFVLDDNGIDETVLAIAEGIPLGVNRDEYVSLLSVREFIETVDSNDEEDRRTLFYEFHSLNGLPEKEIQRYVELDLASNDANLFEERKKAVEENVEKEIQAISASVEAKRQEKASFLNERRNVINTIMEKGEVAGYKFTKEEFEKFAKATQVLDHEIVLPGGIKKKVSLLDKMKYDQQSKDFETVMLNDMLFFFGRDNITSRKIKDDSVVKKQVGSFMTKLQDDFQSGIGTVTVRNTENKTENDDPDVRRVQVKKV